MLLDIPEKELKGLHIISPNGVIRPFVPANFVPKEPKFGWYGDKRIGMIITHLNNLIDSGAIQKIVDFQIISDSPNHFVCFYRYL